MKPLDQALLDHLATEFGEHGNRAVEFLLAAKALLILADSEPIPRLAETSAYCLREAMKTILAFAQDEQAGRWERVSRRVTETHRRYQLVKDMPGEDGRGALSDLLNSIEELEKFHLQASIHQRRLIRIMVSRTGAAPLDTGTDPVKKYQELLGELDSALHNKASHEQVRILWNDCNQILDQLFLPPEIRQQRLRSLATKATPSASDIKELKSLLAAPNHLQYFLAYINDPVWLEALADSGVLDPPRAPAPWPIIAGIERLATGHLAEVAGWLKRMYTRHQSDPSRCELIIRAAVIAGSDALPLVLQAIKDHGASPTLAFLGVWAVERADSSSELVERLSDELLNEQAWQNAVHIEPVLKQIIEGIRSDNARERISLLCWKVRSAYRDHHTRHWIEYRSEGSIKEWCDDPSDRFSSLLGTLLSAVEKACNYLDTETILEEIDKLQGELQIRVRAWVLGSIPGADPELITQEISRAISSRAPTGDDLALIDAVLAQSDPSEYIPRWAEALSTPPSKSEIAEALAAHEIPDLVRRAFLWSELIPHQTLVAWNSILSLVAAVYGPPRGRESLEKRIQSQVEWGHSPFTQEELEPLTPADAAVKIAEWRPDPSRFLGVCGKNA